MLLAILHHTPNQVWVLLAALIALGVWQSRDREVTLARVTVLPLVLIALSFSGVLNAFGHLTLAWIGWAAGVTAAIVVGRPFVAIRTARRVPQTDRLHVPGSWLPLVLIVALFVVKYVANVSVALNPALASDATFAGVCSLAYGSFSGLFLARNWSLRRVTGGDAGLSVA
jgi:hypothetical protein